ncbi:MAG: 16S rRNA (cytidine(1402)-2'-O)-methyltransferase [Patescibacteria group bacterium]|nr:16S rRNA (cytidine(1402)-2'-O)-methyltransferase [Patescibacteria group bacterium]MDD5490426.1 16S rRNA (cytidine(1402)-2'-O)-methyltransferase [Patescibacteria group bacterium]
MGTLYIVATPIGNLEDITHRAVRILGEADLILCEDTRQTKKLLDHYNIRTKTQSYHQHSKLSKLDFIVEELRRGKNIALVSDAGTPGISDPGNKLVEYVVEKLPDTKIVPIPGGSAVIAALSISGFPTDRFKFLGFLPHKKGRETLFKEIAVAKETVAFYESTHRILKTLEQLKNFLDKNRQIVVCRELTKMFESIYRGDIEKVLAELLKDSIKGEFTVVVRGK